VWVVAFAILAYLENVDNKELHMFIKFCFKLGKNVTETFKVACGQQRKGRTQVFYCFSK
jgi:hypothetical protein